MLNQHKTIKDNIAKYNKPNQLADFLLPFVGDKKYVEILDIGSGAYSVIGSELKGVDIKFTHIDSQDFSDFWKKYKAFPMTKIERGDMEHIDYANDWFDIVVCINALDHTNNAFAAVKEMVRVCKQGGYVYIDCHLDQKDTGHKHKWNADENGRFTNEKEVFSLKDFGFEVKYVDNGGERRYNKIVAVLKKDE